MSSEESVIAVSNEISEPERVDSSAIPSSEPLAAKDVSVIADPSLAEPVSDLPEDAAQSPSNDTLPTLLKHDKNIPSTTPTNLNGSANEVGTTTFVNEPDNTVILAEVRKPVDEDEVAEDKVLIKDEVDGDVEEETSGGTGGADLDPADQTLVGDAPRPDADVSVIPEISDVPAKALDDDSWKVVIEEEDGDEILEPVAGVPVEDVVLDITEPVAAPVDEETPAPTEPNPESASVEPPVVETVGVFQVSDSEYVEPVAGFTGSAPAPSEGPAIGEPVIEDLEEAKKVEDHAAEIEVAPIVTGSRIEEPTEEPAVEVVEASPVPKEVAVTEEPTPSVTEACIPGDVEPMAPAAEDDVEQEVDPVEATPPVQDEEAPPEVEDTPASEPDPAAVDQEVAEREDFEETLPAGGPSNEVTEVLVDAEPVVARPLPTLATTNQILEPGVKEAPVVGLGNVAPGVITEEKPVVDEVKEPVPPLEVEEPAPVVTEPVANPKPESEVVKQEVPPPTITEPAVEPAIEEPVSHVPEPTSAEDPPAEPDSVEEFQEPVSGSSVPYEKELVVDEPEGVPPAISEPVEAKRDLPIPDVPEEETKQAERPWTPSYSVSSQGGGLDSAVPAEEEALEPNVATETPVEPAACEPETVTLVEGPPVVEPKITADEVQESPSWTPSYSTTAQGPNPRFESQIVPENDSEPIPAVFEDAPTVTQALNFEPAGVEPVAEEATSQIVTSTEEHAEPETAPGVSETTSWTPSYSTTVQGSGPRFESEATLKDGTPPSEDLPATAQDVEPVQVPVQTRTTVETPGSTATDDIELTNETFTVGVSPVVVDPSSDQARLAQPEDTEPERPKSPWTPSYSVTTLPGSSSSPRIDSGPELDGTPSAVAEASPAERVEGMETPKIIIPEDEKPAEPATETPSWSQSYTVTSQPGSPRISPREELKEVEPEPIVDLADVPDTVVAPAVEDKEDAEPVPEEEPKPAWTQSYSVTSQPGSPRVSPKQVSEDVPEVKDVEPSWTQSYSVTSQPGSPRIPPEEGLRHAEPVAADDEPITVVTPPIGEAAPAPVEVKTPERPKSPWTPSYSVTTLEGQTEQTPVEEAEQEPEVGPVPKTLLSEAAVTDVTSESLVVKGELPEQSHWTPSYSVTTLPGSAPTEEPEPDSAQGEPSIGADVPAPGPIEAKKTVEDQQKENGTTSDTFEVHEAVSRPVVRDEPQVDAETPEPPHQVDLPDDTTKVGEKSSWATSYSVTVLPGASPKPEAKEELPASQDVPITDTPAVEEAEDPTTNGATTDPTKDNGQHHFPEVPESLDEAPEKPKLDLLISTDPLNVTKISPRGRYESTASSRLFPGAWFSSPKSPGDESRTSMEEATGEFILSRSSVAPNEPAVAEVSEDAPASPITPASPTTRRDKKWRMCEIM